VSIYRDTAADWHAAGWAPLPLPARAKMPPPDGWTGRGADYPSRADIQTWLDDPGSDSANLALRMPLGVIGIDVDHYAGKAGGDTLRALVAELGELPATYRLTSRDPGNVSGIRLYRVPDGYPSADMHDPGPHIDLIRPEHRYAVGPGSIHPEGRVYRLYGLDGAVVDGVIKPGDLPELPQAWAQRLTRAKPAKADRSRGTVIGPHFLDIPARAQRAASAFLRQVRGEEVARLPGAQPGERNNVAHAVVCTLLDFADSPWAPYSADDVERDLLEHAPIGGDFTEAEVRRILASAHNRESAGRGRSLPHIVEAELVLSDQSQGPAGEAAPTTSGQRGEAEKGEAKEPREKGPSQATLLAAMALERYDIRADDTGTAYALP
jgi:hypothetical protein